MSLYMALNKFYFIVILISIFALPSVSFAEILINQTDSSTSENLASPSTSSHVQSLGVLNTTIYAVDSYDIIPVAFTTAKDSFLLCTNSDYVSNSSAGCSGVEQYYPFEYLDNSNTKHLNHLTFSSFSTGSKYVYFIQAAGNGTSGTAYGSSSSTISTGACYQTGAGLYSLCPTVLDLYLVLYTSTSSAGSSGVFSITSPSANQVTSTGVVNFAFTSFYNSVVDNYDKFGVQIVDITDSQTINTGTIEHNIYSSGGLSYSDYFGLPVSKNYYVKAYMRSSGASSTPLYSAPVFFTTVSNPNPQTTLPSTGLGSGDSPITSGVATSTVGSSTLNTINPNTILPTEWVSVLKTKFPFSYLFDGFTIISELANGSSVGSAKFTLPLGAVFTNPSNNATSSEITVFNPTAINATGYATPVKDLIGYGLYLTTGLYLLGVIMSAI